jgi:hypothetical protein
MCGLSILLHIEFYHIDFPSKKMKIKNKSLIVNIQENISQVSCNYHKLTKFKLNVVSWLIDDLDNTEVILPPEYKGHKYKD